MNHHSGHSCCGCGSHDHPLSARGVALSHWLRLRFSSLMLVPLTIWMVISIIGLVGEDYATFTEWMGTRLNAWLLGLFILLSCYHAALGVQEIIEDYISTEKTAHCAIVAQKIAFGILVAICIASIVMIVL